MDLKILMSSAAFVACCSPSFADPTSPGARLSDPTHRHTGDGHVTPNVMGANNGSGLSKSGSSFSDQSLDRHGHVTNGGHTGSGSSTVNLQKTLGGADSPAVNDDFNATNLGAGAKPIGFAGH